MAEEMRDEAKIEARLKELSASDYNLCKKKLGVSLLNQTLSTLITWNFLTRKKV